jgi:hypothetical protein
MNKKCFKEFKPLCIYLNSKILQKNEYEIIVSINKKM